jgi:glycosyltransferase involved in cell wall biosynthesis
MKIAWIFPQKKMCGISFYSHAYVEALKPFVDVICIDPEDFINKKNDTTALLRQCRLAHIQYETSLFFFNQKDFYSELCPVIECPIFVTLHEVYKSFPGVFPRDSLQGFLPLLKIKQWLYDRRHPYVTALTKHTKASYYAKAILVHSGFQKDILNKKGIRPEMVSVFPLPVSALVQTPSSPWTGKGPISLVSTGFINDSFDYDLLMKTLTICNLPWNFTWIGGVRRPDDQRLFEGLQKEIARRNWSSRFVITGIVSKEKRDELLSKAHIYCAFFNYKSSSESLATAISSRTMILSTPLPLTREMTRRFPIMVIAPAKPKEMAAMIRRMATNTDLQKSLGKATADYCNAYGRERMAGRLASFYESELCR